MNRSIRYLLMYLLSLFTLLLPKISEKDTVLIERECNEDESRKIGQNEEPELNTWPYIKIKLGFCEGKKLFFNVKSASWSERS